jgi:hypothetical protein
MTDWIPWLRNQLKASAEGFEWAFTQISPALRDQLPPEPTYLGSWPPARYVWHVTEYERCLALPSMQQWLGGALPPEDAWQDDDEAWLKVKDRRLETLIAEFRSIRQQQIELLDQLGDVNWESPRQTLWGSKPLSWIVTKTFQHTYEHGDTLLRMVLWWEVILQAIREEQDKALKVKFVKDLQETWSELQAGLTALTEQQMTNTYDDQGWNVKDHIAHLAAWEESVAMLFQGKPRHQTIGVALEDFTGENIDAINASIRERWEPLTLTATMHTFQNIHHSLMSSVNGLSDEDLTQPVAIFFPQTPPGEERRVNEIIRANTSDHYREHLPWIKQIVEK